MVITVVCDVLGEENNGTTAASMSLIRYLKKQGHTVRVLCADQFRAGEEGFYVTPNLNLGKLLNAYIHKVGITLAKADEEIIRQSLIGADLVHCMIPFSLSMATVKIAKELNIPVTAGFHMQAENFTSYIKLNHFQFANRLVYRFIDKHLYAKVDQIHYPTQFIRDVFESTIKRTTPGVVISNGVDASVKKRPVDKPSAFADQIIILSTGRYAREKSQDTLIKAVNYSKYKDRIQLILAGQGTKANYYHKLARRLPNYPIFRLFSREEIIDVLNYADLYVHPAEFELEGIACLEAICTGKLTIVSDSKLSATKEFAVDPNCIFRKRNPKDLARVIDYWIEHPAEKARCEQLYLDSAKAFNQAKCLKSMEEMMIRVVNEKKQSQ